MGLLRAAHSFSITLISSLPPQRVRGQLTMECRHSPLWAHEWLAWPSVAQVLPQRCRKQSVTAGTPAMAERVSTHTNRWEVVSPRQGFCFRCTLSSIVPFGGDLSGMVHAQRFATSVAKLRVSLRPGLRSRLRETKRGKVWAALAHRNNETLWCLPTSWAESQPNSPVN